MNLYKKLFRARDHAPVVRQAIDLLRDPFEATAFCRARATAVALMALSLKWRPVTSGVSHAHSMGVTVHRVHGGLSDSGLPFWGVVEIGSARYLVSSEEQVLAYLVARQDVPERAAHRVPALLLPKSE